MENKYDVPCFSSRGLFLLMREAITSFHWIGIVIIVWFLLQNSSNCQTTSEPAPILTLRADARKFDPFTSKIAYSPTGRFIASWRNVFVNGGFMAGGNSTDLLCRTSIISSLVLNAFELRWFVVQLLAGFIANRWHRLAVDRTQSLFFGKLVQNHFGRQIVRNDASTVLLLFSTR